MPKNTDNLLTGAEVCVLVNCSIYTLNLWYKFKKENPNNKYAKMLPAYKQYKKLQKRYWRREDIPKIIEFKNAIPKGVNGVMGSVTQRYVKKGEKKK